MVRRVHLAAWLCALAVSVSILMGVITCRGAVGLGYPSCDGTIYLPLDDCPASAQPITVAYTYTIYVYGFNNDQAYVSGPFSGTVNTTSAGTVLGFPASGRGVDISGCTFGPGGGPPNGVSYCQYVYNIAIYPQAGTTSTAISAGFQESCDTRFGYNHGGSPYSYSAYTVSPCQQNGSPNETSNNTFNYTNNTATPQVDSNGNVLQPGQGETVTNTWANGTTGTWGVTNQNPFTGAFNNDTGTYDFSDTNGSLLTSGGITNVQNLGSEADYLAYSNGGPIIWSPDMLTNPAAATAAGDSAIVNGENNLQNALNNDLAGLSNLLSRPLTVNVSNNPTGSGSNVWVMNWPTNFGTGGGTNLISDTNNVGSVSNVWVQNWPTNIDTNTALGMTFANTNQAGNIVMPASQQVTTLSGMVPNSLADNSGTPEEQDITITPPNVQPVVIAMGVLPSTLSTTYSQIRGVIAWFIIVTLAIWNFISLFQTIKTVSLVPQGQGPDTGAWAALGSNVLTALVVASAIVAVISIIPVFAVGVLAGEMSFASSYSTSAPLNFFNQMGWGFQFLSQYLPIYLMFTAFGVRVVYYFGLEVLAFFACIVIKLLIGV